MKNSDATISQPQTDKLKSGDSINIKAVFFEALKNYVEKNNSAWHTPGHNGGAFFLRTPTGREFRDFVGDNICKADLSISVEELGTLLNHSGKMGEAEKNAARVFDADKTYFVLGGTPDNIRRMRRARRRRYNRQKLPQINLPCTHFLWGESIIYIAPQK